MKKIITMLGFLSISNEVFSLNTSDFLQNNSDFSGKFERLYVLGDSLSDTGVLTGAITGFLKDFENPFQLLFPLPKKISFEIPQAYGGRSFTNGKVAAEILADKIGKNLTPAWNIDSLSYMFFNFNGSSKIGTNYAASGAKAVEGNSTVDNVLFNKFTLDKQVNALLSSKGNHNIKDDLFLIMIGGNDIISAIGDNNMSSLDNAVNGIENAIIELYNKGARNFIVTNAPDIGLIPLIEQSNKEKATGLSSYFNSKLDTKIFNFIENNTDVKITYVNIYSLFHNLIQKSKEGMMNTSAPCISNISNLLNKNSDFSNLLADIGSGILPFRYESNCSPEKIKDYFFFDYIHPTKEVHEELGKKIYEQLLLTYESKNIFEENCDTSSTDSLKTTLCQIAKEASSENKSYVNAFSGLMQYNIQLSGSQGSFKILSNDSRFGYWGVYDWIAENGFNNRKVFAFGEVNNSLPVGSNEQKWGIWDIRFVDENGDILKADTHTYKGYKANYIVEKRLGSDYVKNVYGAFVLPNKNPSHVYFLKRDGTYDVKDTNNNYETVHSNLSIQKLFPMIPENDLNSVDFIQKLNNKIVLYKKTKDRVKYSSYYLVPTDNIKN